MNLNFYELRVNSMFFVKMFEIFWRLQPIWSPDFRYSSSCPPGQTILINSVPMTNGPQKFSTPIFRSLQTVPLDKWNILVTICIGRPNWMGTLGTISPWGLNWLGTFCPEGPINWGSILGDQMSGDNMHMGPNESQHSCHKLQVNR